MTEVMTASTRPDKLSLEFGVKVTYRAMDIINHGIDEAVNAPDDLPVEQKPDETKGDTPVTKIDKDTNQHLIDSWEGSSVQYLGEEGDGQLPEGVETPALTVCADPLDGTGMLVSYIQKARERARARLQRLGRFRDFFRKLLVAEPGAAFSVALGATKPDGSDAYGIVGMPRLSKQGPVLWTVSADTPAKRIEPNGREYLLPHATERKLPKKGIVLLSSNSFKKYGAALEAAGFTPVVHGAGVANAMAVMDGSLPRRILPRIRRSQRVVVSFMENGENWDFRAPHEFANKLGYAVIGLDGQPRRYEKGTRGGIFAWTAEIGGMVLRVVTEQQALQTQSI